jgi:hypothetical protein
MHKFTCLGLTLLLLLASVIPSVLARPTNADRLKRGLSPLPPGRRQTAKRAGPSPSPVTIPPVIFGLLDARDITGTKRLGFAAKQGAGTPTVPAIEVIAPTQPAALFLQVNFTVATHNLAGNLILPAPANPKITSPFCIDVLSGTLPIPLTPGPCVATGPWILDLTTGELAVPSKTPVVFGLAAGNLIGVFAAGSINSTSTLRLFLAPAS